MELLNHRDWMSMMKNRSLYAILYSINFGPMKAKRKIISPMRLMIVKLPGNCSF